MKAEDAFKKIQSDLVQVTEPSPENIAEVVKRAIGQTPLREFGTKAGISASTLSRIINGKITKALTYETLLGIINATEYSSEKTLSLYKDLARANGMMSKLEQQALKQQIEVRAVREDLHEAVKQVISTVILARLAERGVGINLGDDNNTFDVSGGYIKNVTEMGIRYDFRLDLESETESYSWVLWAFPHSEDDYSDGSFNPRALSNQLMRELSPIFLADSWMPGLYSGTKITFCFVDWALFECFCHLLKGAALNNRFSAILINAKELSVKEERIFSSRNYPGSNSLFDLPKILSIVQNDADVADENTGNDFLVFSEDGEEE